MKKNFFKLATMVAATFMVSMPLASCDDDDSDKNSDSEEGTFKVRLVQNPSLGNCWYWTNKAEAAADSVSREWEPFPGTEDIDGASSYDIWTFRVKETGIDTLKFSYLNLHGDILQDTLVAFSK